MGRTTEYKTTYVQMFAHAKRVVPPPRDGLTVVHAVDPTIAYYRFIYDAVGSSWNWRSRKRLTDDQLVAIIKNPKDEVHVLFANGVPAGFAELDRRTEGEVEIVQFGLVPEFIGHGLGKYFLQWAIDKAWSYQPKRLWLHTCTEDHPGALPNYLKAGFEVFQVKVGDPLASPPQPCE
jgi:GNAT superfamily N-acetyltransferase